MSDVHSAISAWSDFYAIIGTSAAALTGLVFVVVTLVRGVSAPTSEEGTTAYSTPTVMHFCGALLLAAVLSAPWHSFLYPAAILGIAGLYGIAYVAQIANRTRRHTAYRPDLEDRIWYFSLPFVGYVLIATAAAMLISKIYGGALFALAAASLLLIFVGIHNAWDLVTFIAIRSVQESGPGNDSADDGNSSA